MSFVNCPGSRPAIAAALERVPGLAAAAASSGLFDSSLLADVVSLLEALLGPLLQLRGAGALSSSFDAYLPVAAAGAARRAAASGAPGLAASLAATALGAEGGVPASYFSAPGPSTRFGASSWGAVSSDPGLRPSFGAAGLGSFFDPLRPPPSGGLAAWAPPGLTGAQADAAAPAAPALGSGPDGLPSGSVGATASELAAFFTGAPPPQDDDTFWLAEWVGHGQNPMLMPYQVDGARQLYAQVVSPCARYYKGLLFGSASAPVRIARVLYGIVPRRVVRAELGGGPSSRHLLGEAVNFTLGGVPDSRVVADLAAGVIPGVTVGTFGETAGIHASLPFDAGGQRVERLLLFHAGGSPGYVGYRFCNS